MNLHDLVTQVSQETGLPMQDVKRVIQASFGTIVKTVAADEDVVLVGFGKFALKHNAARQGRNPATGETIDIPPSRGMRFAPGKPVKDALNPPEETKALPAAKAKKRKTA